LTEANDRSCKNDNEKCKDKKKGKIKEQKE